MSFGGGARGPDFFSQAVMLHQQGRLAEAERLYRQVLAADKKHAGALQYLAMIEGQRDNLVEAVRLLRQCVKAHPRLVEARTNLGYVLARLGQHEEALGCYDKALAIDPAYLPALNNRGISLRELRRLDEAVANYDRALALKPDYADALYNKGNLLNRLERFDEALICFDRALALAPNDVSTLIGRATALRGLLRREEAIACLDRVLVLAPGNVTALINQGFIFSDLRRYEEAIPRFEKGLELDDAHPQARSSLALAAAAICDWARAQPLADQLKTLIQTGRAIAPPFYMLGSCDDPAFQLVCAQTFVEQDLRDHPVTPLGVRPVQREAQPRPLRVAYLSADFRRHATAYLMLRLLERHDRDRFKIIGVSIGEDDRSAERQGIVAVVDEFIDVRGLTERAVAQRIADCGADILVDLNVYTLGGRPRILAFRPAPLQVSYLGYPGTSGADYVDYVIADQIILPAEAQPFYTEQIVTLPDYYAAYDPLLSEALPNITRPAAGLPEQAFVFCCFNNNYKINAGVFERWMRLLACVEGSVLWLLSDQPAAERNLRAEAGKRGVDPARIVFAPRVALAEHLARHRCADLFLDTLPYNAHTTVCDALWMGLPVVTCAGRAFAGRVAASALTACGLADLVTSNFDDYEALARALACDPARLAGYRARLADVRATAPPFDAERLRRQIEAAYLRMWEIYQAGEKPRGFAVKRA